VDRFVQECRNIAKVLEEDPETGSREYRYRKLGEDHFRHALNYLYLASQRIGLSYTSRERNRAPLKSETDFNPFLPNYGIEDDYPFRLKYGQFTRLPYLPQDETFVLGIKSAWRQGKKEEE
jgi:hypothetical protein